MTVFIQLYLNTTQMELIDILGAMVPDRVYTIYQVRAFSTQYQTQHFQLFSTH